MARLYMIEHVAEPPSLKELSRICGINEFKLKKGFQEVYQNTVFGYLSEYRLSEAKRLLESRTHTIKEVSFQLGYSSVQHFTKAFKLKYMVSPGKL
ncbi:AraC family transcriptional regulator [Mucilaginibacter roseus]|uniref:AraC family transcriptional regulator n=1 Tax=Mucilaginibacter roseus TaxID=1528868 RepID=A0ABS8TWS1_9SPHI|nr:AraC family transcriptional regulator [Mucilaginibacter roseus]MCD8739331.1 AraC family transcriptional regulator [Mucilaginibacter roseus]